MGQSRYGNSNPVCNICGAIGQAGDRHCRYCGTELKNCANLDTMNVNLGHQFKENAPDQNRNQVSEAYRRGSSQRGQIPYFAPQHNRPMSNTQDMALSIIAVILGAVSLLLLIFSRSSFLFAAAAVILGIVSLVKNREGQGMAVIGICLGGFVILANIFWWFSSIFFMIF